MRIRWTSDLETGIRTIDLQHEELIHILNELDDACSEGCDQPVLDDVFQRLSTYAVFHFSTEESLMKSLPNAEHHTIEHLGQHRAFIEELSGMHTQSRQDGPQTMRNLINFLNEWLYEHILKNDRKLGALLNQKTGEKRTRNRDVM